MNLTDIRPGPRAAIERRTECTHIKIGAAVAAFGVHVFFLLLLLVDEGLI